MPQINNLNMQTIYSNQRKSTDLIYKKDPKNPNLSLLSCSILLLNSCFGIEQFFFDGMYQNGFILQLFFLLFAFAINIISFILLTKCWIYGQSFSFMTLWENSISSYFSWIPNLCIVLCYYQYTFSYYTNAVIVIQDIVYYFSDFNDPSPSILANQFFIVYVFIAIPSLFICCAKEVHNFLILSWIKLFCLISIIGIHIYNFVGVIKEPEFSISENLQIPVSGVFDRISSNFIYTVGLCGNQPVVEHIIQVMKKPTLGRISNVYIISTVIGMALILFISILSTLMYGRMTYTVSMFDFYDQSKKSTIAAKILYLGFLLTTLFLWQWIEARHFSQIFSGSWELSKWMNVFWVPNVLSCFIIVIANAAGTFSPYLATIIFDIIGIVSIVSICLILSPIFFIKLFGLDKSKKMWIGVSIFLIILGMFYIVFTIYIDSKEIANSYF